MTQRGRQSDIIPQYREVRQADLSGGMNDGKNETLLPANQTPNALNMDFDQMSAKVARGSIKFNDQVAPSSGVRCKVDPGLSPLYFEGIVSTNVSKAVPLRGYMYYPYCDATDIGGQFVSEGA